MGRILSKSLSEEGERSIAIEKELISSGAVNSAEVKLLILGAGESGKTTFVKQIKQIYQGGFTPEELQGWTDLVYENLVTAMTAILSAIQTMNLSLEPSHVDQAASFLASNYVALSSSAYLTTPGLPQSLEELWTDAGVQAAVKRASEFQLIESSVYFFNNIKRLHAPGYIPTFEDVLRVRSRTTGIVESRFTAGSLSFRMFDVGGQRNERKKWMHCFDNVTAILFLVGTSEYDQNCFEDHTTNRITESVELFKSINKMPYFQKAAVIMFMNKADLFEEKIKVVPLATNFPAYKGGADVELAKKYLEEQFTSLVARERSVYVHWTCATSTSNIQVVFEAARITIMQSNLEAIGFI
jgi:GTPase SAR1 family protein